MASIVRVPGGFKVRWWTNGRGSKRASSVVFPTKDKAIEHAEKIGHSISAKRKVGAGRHLVALPLTEIVHRWIAFRVAKRRMLAEHTAERTRDLLALVDGRGWRTTADITVAAVDAWTVATSGRGARLGAHLRALLRWAGESLDQPVEMKALLALKPPTGRKRARSPRPTLEELLGWMAKADACSPNAGAFVHCQVLYGWRPVMGVRLQAKDVDLNVPLRVGRKTLTFGRAITRNLKGTGDDREHLLLPETVERLRPLLAGLKPEDFVFQDPRTGRGWFAPRPNGKRNRIAPSQWWRANIDDRVGKGIYRLKNEATSVMRDAGLAPQEGRAFTGQRSDSIFNTYLATNDEQQLRSLLKIAALLKKREGPPRVHGTKSGRTPPDQASA